MRILILLVAALMLPSCCTALSEQYVDADRATYEAVAQVIEKLVDDDPENDPDLSGSNSRSLLLLLESWNLRIERAERLTDE